MWYCIVSHFFAIESFWPMRPPAFFRCLLMQVTLREFRAEPFISFMELDYSCSVVSVHEYFVF